MHVELPDQISADLSAPKVCLPPAAALEQPGSALLNSETLGHMCVYATPRVYKTFGFFAN